MLTTYETKTQNSPEDDIILTSFKNLSSRPELAVDILMPNAWRQVYRFIQVSAHK